jgi:GNAT superfamily N-acetyltransferase
MKRITPATDADIPQLVELLCILFSEEAEFEPDPERHARALREIIARPGNGRILTLREGDAIVAMVSLLFTISTARGGKAALLEDMVVHPTRRADGLGGELLQAATALAREEGCLRITLLTDRANDGAIRFYQRHGFLLSEMIPLRKMLD